MLADNELTLPLPDSLSSLDRLERLDLSGNRFDGSIPPSIGSLVALHSLDLSYNAFRSELPDSILALTNLADDQSDFRFNALMTSNASMQELLDRTQIGGDWASSQTVAPLNASLSAAGIEWDPVSPASGEGHYRIVFE